MFQSCVFCSVSLPTCHRSSTARKLSGGVRADFKTRAGQGFMRAHGAYNSPRWRHCKKRKGIGFKSVTSIEEFNDEYPDERTAEDKDLG